MTRAPEDIVFEVDYWMALLTDVRALNDLVPEAARPLSGASVAVVEAAMGVDPVAVTERVQAAISESMDALVKMDEPLSRLLALVEGRLAVLQREVGEAA